MNIIEYRLLWLYSKFFFTETMMSQLKNVKILDSSKTDRRYTETMNH